MTNDHIPPQPPGPSTSWPGSAQPGPPAQPPGYPQPPAPQQIPGPAGAPAGPYGAPPPGWGHQQPGRPPHYAAPAPAPYGYPAGHGHGYAPAHMQGYGNGYGYGYGYGYDPDLVLLAQGPVRLASQGMRLGARIIDTIVLVVGLMLLYLSLGLLFLAGDGTNSASDVWAVVLVLAVGFLVYEPLSLWRFGCTLGKRMCGLRVCRDDGGRVTLLAAYARFVLPLALAIVPFGTLLDSLWCTWDKPYRQCLHDKAASTIVIAVK